MSLTEKLSHVRALLLTPESDSGNSSSNGTIDEARMSLEEDQTPESCLPFSLTPVSVSGNGSSGNGTVDDDIRRRKSFPKTSPRHTENLRKSMQIDDLSLRQKFRLHLKLKRAEATASKQEEKVKDKAEDEPGHDNNKIRRYSQIVKVQSGLSALAKWKVKTKTTGTSFWSSSDDKQLITDNVRWTMETEWRTHTIRCAKSRTEKKAMACKSSSRSKHCFKMCGQYTKVKRGERACRRMKS